MKFQSEARALDDTTLLLGPFRRRRALKSLLESPDPDAAQTLAEAVDRGSPCSNSAQTALASRKDPGWTDRLWELWANRRQPWLGALLQKRSLPHSHGSSAVGVLSRLRLGGADLPLDAGFLPGVAAHWADPDQMVKSGARAYATKLKLKSFSAWLSAMLEFGEFESIGKDRAAVESVAPVLQEGNPKAKEAARAFLERHVPRELVLFAKLFLQQAADLPIEREVALVVAAYLKDPNAVVAAQAERYVSRVLEAKPDFVVAFALKCGRLDQLAANRATTLQALRLLGDPDSAVAALTRAWISRLPNDQQLNDAIVDEWLVCDNGFLFDLLRTQARYPSDGGKETLLRLLFGDASGYSAMYDTDGRLLAEALAAANETRRKRIVQAIQNSRDAALAEQLLRASLLVQGMDPGLALRALEASGDEDRLVDAARDMKGRELFELCRRWGETGRRPKDARKRGAVDRAVEALRDQPKIVVEPAEPLPAGLAGILDVWNKEPLSDEALRAELQAPDPLIRARALFLGAKRGVVAEDVLRAKSKSEDWPERFAAALHGCHADAANDHVYWVSVCAGQDAGAQEAPVACGPEEFDRAETQLAANKRKGTPWARRIVGELQALQAFRALERNTITVEADDSAPIKGATEKRGDATPEEIAKAFGRGTKKKP